MKILFFFALLINIVFFLWEFNLAPANVSSSVVTSVNNSSKQILLVSELASKEEQTRSRLSIAKNDKSNEIHLVYTDINKESDFEPKAENNKKDEKQFEEIKVLSENKESIDENPFWTKFPDIYLKDYKQTIQRFKKSTSEWFFDNESSGLAEAKHQPTVNIAGKSAEYENVTEQSASILEKTVSLQVAKNDSNKELNFVSKIENTGSDKGIDPENNEQQSGGTSPSEKLSIDEITSDTENQRAETEKNIAQHTTENLTDTIEAVRTEKNSELKGNDKSVESLESESIVKSLNNDSKSIKRNNDSKTAELKKQSCYEIGPFTDYRALNLWRKSNKINQDTFSKFNKNSKVASSYLVYHPAEASLEESKAMYWQYKRSKISDLWLIRKGALKGAISFGLFTAETRALKYQKRLLKKKINVEIMRRYKTVLLPYARILTEDESFRDKVAISGKQEIKECN